MYLLPPTVSLCACLLSHIRLFATLSTVAHQAPLSMGFSRQENRSGLPFPSPTQRPDLPSSEAELTSPSLAGGFLHLSPMGSPTVLIQFIYLSAFLSMS